MQSNYRITAYVNIAAQVRFTIPLKWIIIPCICMPNSRPVHKEEHIYPPLGGVYSRIYLSLCRVASILNIPIPETYLELISAVSTVHNILPLSTVTCYHHGLLRQRVYQVKNSHLYRKQNYYFPLWNNDRRWGCGVLFYFQVVWEVQPQHRVQSYPLERPVAPWLIKGIVRWGICGWYSISALAINDQQLSQ